MENLCKRVSEKHEMFPNRQTQMYARICEKKKITTEHRFVGIVCVSVYVIECVCVCVCICNDCADGRMRCGIKQRTTLRKTHNTNIFRETNIEYCLRARNNFVCSFLFLFISTPLTNWMRLHMEKTVCQTDYEKCQPWKSWTAWRLFLFFFLFLNVCNTWKLRAIADRTAKSMRKNVHLGNVCRCRLKLPYWDCSLDRINEFALDLYWLIRFELNAFFWVWPF